MPSEDVLPATAALPASTVTIVVAIARNGVIGSDGGLPWRLPGDLPRLKALTMGHVLVMGRLTYDSIGRPLPGRTTVVVTRQSHWRPPSGHGAAAVVVVGSVEQALWQAAQVDRQIFVFGGAQIYAATLTRADALEVTWVEAEPEGDTYFPQMSWDDWVEVSREPHQGWSAARYERAQKKIGENL